MLIGHADEVDKIEVRHRDDHYFVVSFHESQAFAQFVSIDQIAQTACSTSNKVWLNLELKKIVHVENVKAFFEDVCEWLLLIFIVLTLILEGIRGLTDLGINEASANQFSIVDVKISESHVLLALVIEDNYAITLDLNEEVFVLTILLLSCVELLEDYIVLNKFMILSFLNVKRIFELKDVLWMVNSVALYHCVKLFVFDLDQRE